MNESDPRPDFLAALVWALSRAEALTPEQFAIPSPCDGWSVGDVVAHCAKVAGMVVGRLGGEAPAPADGDAGAVQTFASAAAAIPALVADDTLLDKEVAGPRGPQPVSTLLRMFTGEFLAHGWDIASVSGQDAEANPELAERALAFDQAAIPAEGRALPAFGPVVEVGLDAGPTRRLAAWLGR